MSTFVPDPNLVVEALRFYAEVANGRRGKEALPHAQAIAEMWDGLDRKKHAAISLMNEAGKVLDREPAVQELIVAARSYERLHGFSGDAQGDRFRAALNAVPA